MSGDATWRVRASAPAKLTLSLRVLGRRPDGFHELDALTAMISAPADTLVVRAAPAGTVGVAVAGPAAAGVPADEENLVVRAARALLPAGTGVEIELEKVTPAGAGLGGGSADAAAVLRALADRFGVDRERVMAHAATIGSDVPVCVRGEPVFMRGRGEILEPVALRGPVPVVVAVPPFAVDTAAAFRTWDELGGPGGSRAIAPPDAVAHLVGELVNDLEPAAERVQARLTEFRTGLRDVVGAEPVLAGSGSSYWLPVADPETATAVAARVRDEMGVTTFAGHVLERIAEGASD
ncbi:MAG: 4-(cytidine 5'-diphospho)-2-C-methyl-D-erythritol kinase [Acidimicrobiia bacterium]